MQELCSEESVCQKRPSLYNYYCRSVASTSSHRTTDSDRWPITTGSWLQPAVIDFFAKKKS